MRAGPVATVSMLAAMLAASHAPAQSYPAKPIRLLVPLAPGGPSDIMGRTIAAKLTEGFGQTVVVDNRPGAGGSLGADLVAKSPPDGYTLLLVSNSLAINASLYPKLPYDTLRDFAPVSVLSYAPYLLTVHPSLPVKTPRELIALAKARPGQLNYASGGSGTGPHMAMELLKIETGANLLHVPYKGAGPAMIDTIAGQCQAMMVNIIAGLPHVKSGRLRALAVSTAKRASVAPDLPPLADTLPGFDESGQHGIVAPAGTPTEIVQRLHAEIVKALQSPQIRSRLVAEGAEVAATSPAEYADALRNDVAKWAKVIRQSGIRAN